MTKEFKKLFSEFKNLLIHHNYNCTFNQIYNYFPSENEFWDSVTIKKYWKKFIDKGLNTEAIDLYIHIPYCATQCSFCAFHPWLYKDNKSVNIYVDYLIEEMRFFSGSFRKIRFQQLYLGGGTVNILNKIQLSKIITHIHELFLFTKDARKSIECNPDITKEWHMRQLRQMGFNRMNFGVQSLTRKALKINNRSYQTYNKVKNAMLFAKKHGFTDIGVDLIAGLAGDTLDDFAKSFTEIAKLKPANIIVYALRPPNKKYITNLLRVSEKEYFKQLRPGMISGAFEVIHSLADQYGYFAGDLDPTRCNWGFMRKDFVNLIPEKVYSGEVTGCRSVLGIGVNSASNIFGQAHYKQVKQPQVFSSTEKLFKGKILSQREEMLRFILNHLDMNSNIPKRIFRDLFAMEVKNAFPFTLYVLKLLKKINDVTNDFIQFSFYTPEEKYIYTLFFFREAGYV